MTIYPNYKTWYNEPELKAAVRIASHTIGMTPSNVVKAFEDGELLKSHPKLHEMIDEHYHYKPSEPRSADYF